MLLSKEIQQVVHKVQQGGVIAYPTEAVFGLGCDPTNTDAIEGILRLKERPIHKGLILIASTISQVTPFIMPLTADEITQLTQPLERPTTWIVPAKENTSRHLRGDFETIAIRITQHPDCIRLCNHLNSALVSTSANPAGLPPARETMEVLDYFPEGLDAILDMPVGTAEKPSQLIDFKTKKVLRT